MAGTIKGGRFYLDGVEVSKEIFDAAFPSKLDAMLQAGQPPYGVTDSTFLSGECNGSQFERQPQMGDFLRAVAERHGQNTKGKKYLASLADFPGDPEAWVSGRGDVEAVIRKRGWNCEGSVNVKAMRNDEEPKTVGLDPQLVMEKVVDTIQDHPEPQSLNLTELKQEIVNRHTPYWATPQEVQGPTK